MVKLTYTVHSCARLPFQVPVELNGKEVMATVDGLVIELVVEDKSVSHTLRIVPDDIDAAQAEFAEGAAIEATFEAAPKKGK
jgi:hypothetical protein